MRQRRIRQQWAAVLLTVFALIHGLYYASGVRFDAGTLPLFAQFLDPALLQNRLAESLWYLHSQPPLFNLLLGIALKIAPHDYPILLTILFVGCGLGLFFGLFWLMRRLNVARPLALLVSALFAFSPSFVLYEHWLFYTFLEAALMTAGAGAFYEAVRRPQSRAPFIFFSIILALCTLRSLFHLVYFVGMAGLALACMPQHRRTVWRSALVPFLLLFALYAKNYLLFGKFALSTWTGMNFADVTLMRVAPADRDRMIAAGQLSPTARIRPFETLDAYPAEVVAVSPYDVPALTQRTKPAGVPNYNHFAYIGISDRYQADDKQVIRHDPRAFGSGLATAWQTYFEPSTNYYLLPGRAVCAPIIGAYDALAYGRVSTRSGPRYALLWLGLPLLTGFALWMGKRPCKGVAAGYDAPQRALLLYCGVNILYVAVIGNTLDAGENMRFRFATDPLTVILIGAAAQQSYNSLRARKSALRANAQA